MIITDASTLIAINLCVFVIGYLAGISVAAYLSKGES